MKSLIYKFEFQTPVHFGDNKLENSLNCIYADTIFSALCIEAKKIYGEQGIIDLVNWVDSNQLLISDAFPYYKDDFFIPKPIAMIEQKIEEDNEENLNIKKKLKKIEYIKLEELDDFLRGNYNFNKENILDKIGELQIRPNVSLVGEEPEPYNTGIFSFQKNYGLYILVLMENNEIKEKIENILESLSYSGIGGKRSSGFGKFELKRPKTPEKFNELLSRKKDRYINLSILLPKEEELEKISKEDTYLLLKRSGFIYSEDYASNYRKKRDLYMFKSGSCFKNKFLGDIYDVSEDGNHKVFKYGKAIMIGV